MKAKILEWFKENYKELVIKMKNTNHDYNELLQNPYHLENDVWSHTMMVFNEVKENNEDLLLMCLLHDIGKPFTEKRNEETKRVSFKGHENFSSFLALPILNKFKKEMNNNINIELILKCINRHTELIKMGEIIDQNIIYSDKEINKINKIYYDLDYYDYMLKLTIADMNGRICIDRNTINNKINFLNNFLPTKLFSNKENLPEFIMLIGLPGSGKSTLAEKMMKEKKYTYLSSDKLLMEKASYQSYGDMRNSKNMNEVIIEIKKLLHEACLKKENIILDMLNLSNELRKKYLEIVPEKYYYRKAINFIVSEEKIFENNKKRKNISKMIPETEIYKMIKKYEYADEYHFDKVVYKIVE